MKIYNINSMNLGLIKLYRYRNTRYKYLEIVKRYKNNIVKIDTSKIRVEIRADNCDIKHFNNITNHVVAISRKFTRHNRTKNYNMKYNSKVYTLRDLSPENTALSFKDYPNMIKQNFEPKSSCKG